MGDSNPGIQVDTNDTALVVTDPQNDFLSPEGVTWGIVGESVTENNTVEKIETLFKAPKENGVPFSYRLTTTIQQIMVGNLKALWRR